MSIANNTPQASTVFKTAYEEIYSAEADLAQLQEWCDVETVTGTNVEVRHFSAMPLPRKWTGSKQYQSFRANRYNVEVVPFEASTTLEKRLWLGDPDGAARALKNWLGQNKRFLNKIVYDKLVSQAQTLKGFDDVSDANDSHPNAPNGGTYDNVDTTSFSRSQLLTDIKTIRSRKDENGQPLNLGKQITVMCGSLIETDVLDAVNSQTIMKGIASTGAEDSGTRIAAAGVDNVVNQLGVKVVHNPYMGSYEWITMDTGAADKPFKVYLLDGVKPSDDTNEFMSTNAEYHFSLEAFGALAYGPWFLKQYHFATS